MQVCVQFCFTSVFGLYEAFLLTTTGHLAAAIAVHIFCNAMGFPAFQAVWHHQHWAAILAAFVAGIAGFIAGFAWVSDPALYANTGDKNVSVRYVDAILGAR